MEKIIKKRTMSVVERTIEDVYSRLYIPEIKDILETSFDFISDSALFHTNSRLDLRKFKALFIDRVEDHRFLKVDSTPSGYSIELDIPNVDTFNFNGLEVLELITLGVPANYVELDERMRRQISPSFPKAPLSFRVEGTTVYLYDTKRYSSLLATLKEKKMDIMIFPFSIKNKGFDVFQEADIYDDENFDSMLELVHNNITKELKTELRR